MELQAFEHAPGFAWKKGLVQRGRLMGIEVVQHHADDLSIGKGNIHQPLHLMGKVRHGAPFGS